MKLVSIPFNISFLEIVVRQWIKEYHQVDITRQGIIIVPNQRTVKAFIDTFLRVTNGKPILLPRIFSIGAIDESVFLLNGHDELTINPPVDSIKRIAILSTLIMRMDQVLDKKEQAGEVWKLACSLAELMDEAEWSDCNLQEALPKAVEGEYALHWQNVLQFLTIITDVWPNWLAENHLMNPVARKIALLRAQANMWRQYPDPTPVWAVGFIDARPAVIDLLSAIIGLPKGRLIMSGIQYDLPDAIWNDLSLTHPYAEMSKMFTALQVNRTDFIEWADPAYQTVDQERVNAFEQTLLPAELLDQWLANPTPIQLHHCYLSEPTDQQQEAVSIALMIRDALEQPEKKIALVTPDRNLAMRVALELGRWGIIADDSAGEPLYKTSAAVLLNLLLQACIEQFSPVSLLALLKHPLVCCGYDRKECREYTRLLEINILRQFAASGLSIIEHAIYQKKSMESHNNHQSLFLSCIDEISNLIRILNDFVSPLLSNNYKRSLDQWAISFIQVVELLVTNHEVAGDEILWRGEEGNALANHLRNLIADADVIDQITLQEFESILTASYAGLTVHSRRALRGRTQKELHPRVYIWGLIEARLQIVDMVVLAGLSEGVWPPVIDSGPWISRPMRAAMGISLPDAEVGRSAYDFMLICCSVPEVILSTPLRRDNAPVVPSRWISRLKAWLHGRNSLIESHPALDWAKLLDHPQSPPKPIASPYPTPALGLRPKSISVTDVEYWLKDPYEIYAKRILRLRKIPGLEEDRSASIFGNIVHDGLQNAFVYLGKQWNQKVIEDCLLQSLADRQDIIPSLKQWWHARILRIASWVYDIEQQRRDKNIYDQIYPEIAGKYFFGDQYGLNFTLTGIADRIDLNSDGNVEIFDYKTGRVPSKESVWSGLSPQLPLEAAMAYYGAFGDHLASKKVKNLYYWQLKGDLERGKETCIDKELKSNIEDKKEVQDKDEENLEILIQSYWDKLKELIIAYNDPKQPYLSRPRPYLFQNTMTTIPRFGDYAHLARVLEWGTSGEDE